MARPRPAAPRPVLGYFGGSFDPVQSGHLALARAALRQEKLRQVHFVPAGRSPLKSTGPRASDRDRLRMLRLALGRRREFPVSRWDLGPGPSYTYKTLRRLRRQNRAEWRLILGSDSLKHFEKWRRWREILRHHVVLVGARKGEKGVRPPRGFADRVRFLRGPLPRVSSTAIRDRLARGRSLRGLTPAPVAAYIRRRGLYRP